MPRSRNACSRPRHSARADGVAMTRCPWLSRAVGRLRAQDHVQGASRRDFHINHRSRPIRALVLETFLTLRTWRVLRLRMLQRATFTPEGGIPASCTDAWSKEQVLIEPYRHVFFRTHAESVSGEDVGLQPPDASPRPLKRPGLRRAKARCCQRAVKSERRTGSSSPSLLS